MKHVQPKERAFQAEGPAGAKALKWEDTDSLDTDVIVTVTADTDSSCVHPPNTPARCILSPALGIKTA